MQNRMQDDIIRETEKLQKQQDQIEADLRNPEIPYKKRPLKEFFDALFRGYTYKPHRNIHLIFGFIWGLPVPVLALIMQINQSAFRELTASVLGNIISNTPAFLIPFYGWPLISSVIFGAMGTVRKKKTARLNKHFQHLERLSLTDSLTGLYNQRYMWIRLNEELQEATRNDRPLSVLLCDLDGFKEINDRFGHDVGDECLRSVAKRLEDACREYDIVTRHGGDEFVFILPETGKSDARNIAKRVKASIEEEEPIRHPDGTPLELGISVGVATCPEDETDSKALIKTADERMYEMKKKKRESRRTRPEKR